MAVAASSILLPSIISPKRLVFISSSKARTPVPHGVLSFSPRPSNDPVKRGSLFSFPLCFPLPFSRMEPATLDRGRSILRKVVVSSELERAEKDEASSETDFSQDLKLFVGNLPFSVDSAELAGLFGRAGNVEMVEVIYDKLSGRSRGFGFVTMSTVEEVEAAEKQFNNYELGGRALRVNSGPPPSKDELSSRGSRTGVGSYATNRVYVGNLSWGVDDLALETLFSEQGKVMEAKVVYDRESGRSRGFGFVSFGSAEEVNNAISSLNGVDLDGRTIRVMAAEARSRRQE